jgi:hypothetical protein
MKRLLRAAGLAAGFLLAVFQPALADGFDPRIVNELAAAKTAEVTMLQAAMRAMIEDSKKREAEWAEYSKSLWQAVPEK